MKRGIPLFLLFTTMHAVGQQRQTIGYSIATLNAGGSLAGGLSFSMGRNLLESHNTSLSVSTNLKFGMQDKIGSGLIIPLAVLVSGGSGASNFNYGDGNGGKIHLFTEVPLLLHLNVGMGATAGADYHRRFGFYLGGGMSYCTTGFTDSSGLSKGTAFFGYVLDGGIRFSKNADLNLAWVTPLRYPIGQISHPVMYEMTLSFRF